MNPKSIRFYGLLVFLALSSLVSPAQSVVLGLPGATGSSQVLWPPALGSKVFGLPSTGPATIIHTIFNEGTVGTPINGTSPAVNSHGNLWVAWPSVGSLQFAAATGAQSTGTSNAEIIDTGATAYTVTFGGLTNTATNYVIFSMSDALTNDRMEVQLLGAGGIAFREVVSGVPTVIQTKPVADGATGSVVAVVNGTSITVTAFGQTPMTYTIPGGHADIGGRFLAMFSTTFAYTFGNLTVTVP